MRILQWSIVLLVGWGFAGALCAQDEPDSLSHEAEERPAPPSEPAPVTAPATLQAEERPSPFARSVPADEGSRTAYVVPLQGQVGPPMLFILRRALKEAIENDVRTVVVDLDTPGGRLDTTLEMMEIIDGFEGDNIVYINDEAISAGAYISIAHDIITYAPGGVIGAAEAVTGTGEDIPEALSRKINSYLRAKVRTVADEDQYRADVMRAMMDPEFELNVDGEVLKEEGELLTLTADEGMMMVGDPPRPLFGAGIFDSVEDLLDERYGAGEYEIVSFEITWSERLAQYLEIIAPTLLGIGLLALFIEFKTPGFGIPGVVGIVLIGVVFLSNYVAGLAGYEPLIIFALGVLLIFLEILFFPGVLIFAMSGILMMVGSLIWSLADIWPAGEGEGIGGLTVSAEAVESAIARFTIGLVIAFVGAFFAFRFLPKTPLFRRLVLERAAGSQVEEEFIAHETSLPSIGATGIAVNDLHPGGTVEIEGRRYEASAEMGWLTRGQGVRVTGHGSFGLKVVATES